MGSISFYPCGSKVECINFILFSPQHSFRKHDIVIRSYTVNDMIQLYTECPFLAKQSGPMITTFSSVLKIIFHVNATK